MQTFHYKHWEYHIPVCLSSHLGRPEVLDCVTNKRKITLETAKEYREEPKDPPAKMSPGMLDKIGTGSDISC